MGLSDGGVGDRCEYRAMVHRDSDEHDYSYGGIVAPECMYCGHPNPRPLTDAEQLAHDEARAHARDWWRSMRRSAGLDVK